MAVLAEGAEATAERPLPGERAASTWTITPPSTTPSRTAPATSCTRAFWTATPRAVFNGKIYRPPGRAEDRRQADQQEPGAFRRRRHQHQAGAADLRRRRALHARRDHRPARRRSRSSTCGRAASAREQARDLLTYAFARDIVDRIKVEPLRDRLEQVLFERLHEHAEPLGSSFDVEKIRAGLPDPRARRCTASRWSISTTPPPARSRRP